MDYRKLIEACKEVRFLGLVCPQVWLWFMLRSLDAAAPLSFEVFYAAEGLALLAIAATVIFAPRRLFERSKVLPILIALVMFASPLLARFVASSVGSWLTVLAAFAGAAALMGNYAQYFILYSKLDARRMASYVLISFALVPVVRFPLEAIPADVATVIASFLPFVSLALLYRANALRIEEGPVDSRKPATARRTGLVLVVVELAIYGFAMGLFRISSVDIHGDFTYIMTHLLLKTAFPLIMLLTLRFFQRRISVSMLCQIALIVILTSIVTAVNFHDNAFVAYVVFDFTRNVMVILLFFTLCMLATHTSRHPVLVFCVGWAPYAFAMSGGMVVANVLGSFASFGEMLVVNLVWVLAVSTMLVFMLQDGGDLRLFPEGAPDEVPLRDFDEIDARCDALGAEYRLTNRELETMKLICKGRSKRYIAEQLMLSENTVRGYAKTLYAKLGIHNRQALLDLLEME